MIFGCFDNNPQFVYDMQETYLKMCLLNIVWKPRDVFLVDGISQLRCLYTIQADANVVKLKRTKVWHESMARRRERDRRRAKRYYQEHKEELAEKKKEYRKIYNKIDVECEVCKCTVRKCGWVKHQ